jgi:tetratricopeptide (TPR) repeat protein
MSPPSSTTKDTIYPSPFSLTSPSSKAPQNSRAVSTQKPKNTSFFVEKLETAITNTPSYSLAYIVLNPKAIEPALACLFEATEAPINLRKYSELTKQGITHYLKDEFKEAIDIFSQTLNLHEAFFVQSHYNLGCAYHMSNRLKKAIAYYTQALERDPKHFYSLVNRAIVYSCLNRLAEAKNDFEAAMTLNNLYCNNFYLYFNYGNYFMLNEQFKMALIFYTKVHDITPSQGINQSFAYAYYNLGYEHQKRKDFTAAANFYKQACMYKPDFDLAKLAGDQLIRFKPTNTI